MTRGAIGNEEYLYNAMFDADVRQRDKEVAIWATESAWFLHDTFNNKHKVEGINYDEYY